MTKEKTEKVYEVKALGDGRHSIGTRVYNFKADETFKVDSKAHYEAILLNKRVSRA